MHKNIQILFKHRVSLASFYNLTIYFTIVFYINLNSGQLLSLLGYSLVFWETRIQLEAKDERPSFYNFRYKKVVRSLNIWSKLKLNLSIFIKAMDQI